MTTPTMTTQLGAFLQTAAAIVANDALTGTLPLINAFFQNIQQNSSPANVAAQASQLQVTLLTDVPNLEQAAIRDLAAFVQQTFDAAAAQLQSTIESKT